MRSRMRPVGTSELLVRGRPTNSEIPVGALYPNGLPFTEPNPDVQASTRPPGAVFVQSPGYESVRLGRNRFQDPQDFGSIGFVGIDLAEDPRDPNQSLVDPNRVGMGDTTRIHPDLPHEGENSLAPAVQTRSHAPTEGGRLHRVYESVIDMGDREPSRPLSRTAAMIVRDPVSAFRGEYADHPVTAIAVAAGVISIAYLVGSELERQWNARRTRGSVPSGAAAAAPATVATAGREARRATDTAADAVEEAGKAVEKATETAADAVKPD